MTTSTSETAAPTREDLIREEALRLGFDVCRFADASAPWDAGARLAEFVAQDRHGEMGWMADTLERRSHPTAMWDQARSAILLGVNYGPEDDPLAALERRDRGAISVYAQGSDYHEVIKKRLKQLAGWMAQRFGAEVKVFVDTAPLLEKPLAEAAGLGWQGKHTNLVSRQFGSWLFIGSVLTSLELAPDAAVEAAPPRHVGPLPPAERLDPAVLRLIVLAPDEEASAEAAAHGDPGPEVAGQQPDHRAEDGGEEQGEPDVLEVGPVDELVELDHFGSPLSNVGGDLDGRVAGLAAADDADAVPASAVEVPRHAGDVVLVP